MRPVLTIAITFSALLLFDAATAAAQSRTLFDPGGGLFLISGRTPKAFASFEGIWLSTNDYKTNGRVVPIKPVGELQAGGRYKMTRVVYNENEFSFETVALKSVSYRFSGRLVDNIRYDASGHTVGTVLRGHLEKLVHGRVAAEADLDFEFEEGG